MVLVDTSVWLQHFRKGDRALAGLLHDGQVLMHPFVWGELACGNIRNRSRILAYLNQLPQAKAASHDEALRLVEVRQFWGRGVGWIDAHLLASVLISDCRFWTYDAPLAQAASDAGVSCLH